MEEFLAGGAVPDAREKVVHQASRKVALDTFELLADAAKVPGNTMVDEADDESDDEIVSRGETKPKGPPAPTKPLEADVLAARDAIREANGNTYHALIEQGCQCFEWSKKLKRGQRECLWQSLGWDKGTFSKWVAIGKNADRLKELSALLPPVASIMYLVVTLDKREFEVSLKSDVLHPNMRRAELEKWIQRIRKLPAPWHGGFLHKPAQKVLLQNGRSFFTEQSVQGFEAAVKTRAGMTQVDKAVLYRGFYALSKLAGVDIVLSPNASLGYETYMQAAHGNESALKLFGKDTPDEIQNDERKFEDLIREFGPSVSDTVNASIKAALSADPNIQAMLERDAEIKPDTPADAGSKMSIEKPANG